jgi:pimeloyl-ACP methyl ester carboxylesterase
MWGRIHVPVIYLQGDKDGLVDTTNAGFAQQHLINAPSLDIRMIPGRGHLIAFSEKERIEKAIVELLDKTEGLAKPAGVSSAGPGVAGSAGGRP